MLQSADPLRTPNEAANFLQVSPGTLSVWRCTGRYPLPFIKVGRLIRYRQSSLEEFLKSRERGGLE